MSHSDVSLAVAGDDAPTMPPPYTPAPRKPREPLDCWACAVLITAHNLLVGVSNLLIFIALCGGALAPAGAMLVYGFLCHPKFRRPTEQLCSPILTPAACTALLVFGIALLLPLLVLGLAAYARLARGLQLGSCFLPYSRAVYQTAPQRPHVEKRRPQEGKAWV
ncbi:transmembrane protein 88 [Bombina bombina]|uniref:transmembrane protein 88 n=1 Tax=Bombina bombina TaxID=8345 RepID=UPI00235A7AF9|nr:transmembrane protein 88 [Bombina bombina]